jgi:cysteine desulfurase
MNDLCVFGFVNASATTTQSQALQRLIKKLSNQFIKAAELDEVELIWTGGGTEANNMALLGSAPPNGSWIGREIVTSIAEHPSVDQPLRVLEGHGAIVRRVPIDKTGRVNIGAFESTVSPATHLVSICLVQSETGALQDLVAIRNVMNRRCPNALLHVDAVQGLVKSDLLWKEANVDLMAFAGHKFHALGGTGLLAVRAGVELKPIIHGGGQQKGLRSGSLDGIGIVSFLFAALTLFERRDQIHHDVAALNRSVRDALTQLLPAVIFNSTEDASPFILNASLPGYEGAVLMRLLDSIGVTIGTGSACSAGSSSPSQVLTAMGLDRKTAFAAVRISFGCLSTSAEVERFLERLESALQGY